MSEGSLVMLLFCFCIILVQCALLFMLRRAGGRLQGRAEGERIACDRLPEHAWPRIAVIVPASGADPRMDNALASLLAQDYPDFIPVLVTAGADEPAALLARKLQHDFPRLRYVTAGPAEGCGQKNHNSLQGVGAVAGDDVAIYVFCDSTHCAAPDFLRCLVFPIVSGQAECSTGYHSVEPRDSRPLTLAYAVSVLLMRLLQAVSAFTQPWGGAMAVRKEAFAGYAVADLWAHAVVDDCSLAALLRREHVPVALSAAALLRTVARNHAFSVWHAWMERQVLFLKFCMPDQWLLLGSLVVIMGLPPLCALFAVVTGLLGWGGGGFLALSLLWLCLLTLALGPLRKFLSAPVDMARWLAAFLCASGVFAHVYLKSLFAREIAWGDFVYAVGKGGRVLSVRPRMRQGRFDTMPGCG